MTIIKEYAKLVEENEMLLKACKELHKAINDNVEAVKEYSYVRLQYIADEMEEMDKAIKHSEEG